ncbi:MAG: RdgB/HAM1 family non-canonical purine NTP pyrophosphatase [Myxococcota bacterium]|nr:RdgB/HAM1 family non-canonical purine NTP pyrophosphatase [Myxococcota bacterium]
MYTLVLATGNPGKTAEFRARLAPLGIDVSSLSDLDLNIHIEEDALTFQGNAEKKALTIAKATDRPTLADDSGLEVAALDGRPGVYSARYGGPGLTDQDRCERLISELSTVPAHQRGARFRAVLAFAMPGTAPLFWSGSLEGMIARKPAGVTGFGYDPIFIPSGFGGGKTLAELGPAVKNRISHRAMALDAFIEWFQRHNQAVHKPPLR